MRLFDGRAGLVLEIGPGHGSTLPYVSGAIQDGSIRSITFFEPNQAMHAELRAAAVKAGALRTLAPFLAALGFHHPALS